MMAKKIASYLFPSLIILITIVLCYLNYTPGTFLTGWDTLHPEFNFPQSFANAIFGSFRTDQGLGAIAAHAHMADLPRIALLWIFSILLPLSFLRYSIVFLCLILGPLGIYFFTKLVLSNKTFAQNSESIPNINISTFLASLVYIFNLGTVQHFYLPFEMFMVQYAALGWLFLTSTLYIQKQKIQYLMLFALISFLATPMAYAPVLWYAYFAAFCLYLALLYIQKRNKKVLISIILLILTTLSVNTYWLLPNIYFLINGAGNVSEAQINKIFSDEAFLHNKQYGNIIDTAILRNFLFNWTQQINPNVTVDLMIFWKNHLTNPLVTTIGYLTFIITLLGIMLSVIRKNILGIALIPVFTLALIMLINMNPPFEFIFAYLRDNFTLFREGLRFPFTKFSLLIMFSGSIFFAICISEIINLLLKFTFKKTGAFVPYFVLILVSSSLIFYGFPMFRGQLIDPSMRIVIPQDYFRLFEYMKQQPNSARLAPLPLHSLWGWEYYDWKDTNNGGGYQGAGFIWFGMNQPVLARDFDRWNVNNEIYLREMSSAIYSRDINQIEALARKFRISYFLLDESVYSPNSKPNALWHYETHDTFKKSGKIKLAKNFGKLFLYKFEDKDIDDSFIQKPLKITYVDPQITGGFVDSASQHFGDYVIGTQGLTYPSRALVGKYDRIDPNKISIQGNILNLSLGENYEGQLTTSWLSNDIFPEFMRNTNYDLSTEEKGLPYTIGNKTFFSIPITSAKVNIKDSLVTSRDCGINTTSAQSVIETRGETAFFSAKDSATCGFISFPNEKQDFGSIVMLEARNIAALPIRLCISEILTSRCDIYTALDSDSNWKKYAFMIPPQPSGATGYAVHFNTIGIGNEVSQNEIRNVQFIQIPYYRIANLSFVKPNYVPLLNGVTNLKVKEANSTLYFADVTKTENSEGLISLFKAYDDGWKAYEVDVKCQMLDIRCQLPFMFGKEIKQHVLVNNWANGWILPKQSTPIESGSIIIVFLPQYLQYIGFVGTIATVLGIAIFMVVEQGIKLRKN